MPKLVQEITGSILLQGLRGGAGGGGEEGQGKGEREGAEEGVGEREGEEGEKGEGNRNRELKLSQQETIDLSRIQHTVNAQLLASNYRIVHTQYINENTAFN